MEQTRTMHERIETVGRCLRKQVFVKDHFEDGLAAHCRAQGQASRYAGKQVSRQLAIQECAPKHKLFAKEIRRGSRPLTTDGRPHITADRCDGFEGCVVAVVMEVQDCWIVALVVAHTLPAQRRVIHQHQEC